MYDYLSMLGLKLIHASKRGPKITQKEKYMKDVLKIDIYIY